MSADAYADYLNSMSEEGTAVASLKLPGHEDGSGWGIRQDMKEVLQGQHGVLFEQAIEQFGRAQQCSDSFHQSVFH